MYCLEGSQMCHRSLVGQQIVNKIDDIGHLTDTEHCLAPTFNASSGDPAPLGVSAAGISADDDSAAATSQLGRRGQRSDHSTQKLEW